MRKNSNFSICEGDWPQFVVYHKLRPGDNLLFLLIEKSTFLVVPYAQKNGRNFRGRQPFEELSSSSEEEEEEDIEPSHLGVKFNVKADEMIHLKKKIPEQELFTCLLSDYDNPKRPLGSYIVFMEEFKKRCLEVNPNIKSFDAVEKLVGDKWKKMSDAEKAPYIAEAEKRRVENAKVWDSYNQLMAAGYAKEGDKSNAKANYVFHMKKKARGLKKLRRIARDLDIPKRPASAYFIFMEEFRKQFRELNPNIKSIAAVGKAGGSKWKQMSDAEKAPYIAEEEKRKLEYAKRMDAYNRRVGVVDADEEESDESRFEFDDEEGSTGDEEEDEI